MSDEPKLSPVEKIKAESNFLRGSIAEELRNEEPAFEKDTTQLIKHHGFYEQDDRDLRGRKDEQGNRLPKTYSVMIRTKLPGGKLTSEQMLVEFDICDKLGNGTIRLTDRQGIQHHGVLKHKIKETIRRINDAGMTTLGACGDVSRNVLCCPAPLRQNGVRDEMQALADQLSERFMPRSGAYQEIWLTDQETGEKQQVTGESEPDYGPTYLPRKFKMAIVLPEDNCVDAYANDVGLIAVVENDAIVGYNLIVGGGLGVTPSNKKTFPAVAKPLCFVEPNQVIDTVGAVLHVFRDHGNRENRKRARLKYLIADWGLERFAQTVQEHLDQTLVPPRPVEISGFEDHIGWHKQGDDHLFYGLNIENGRILDRHGFLLKTAIRAVCETFKPGLRITGHQSLLFTDIRPEDRSAVEKILRTHGVKLHRSISNVRRWSIACVALPTCPLAVTESERALPALIDELEVVLSKLGLSEERFSLRMSGCANGCSRMYIADIGIVGKAKDKYTLYLGGRLLGDRLGYLYKDLVPRNELVSSLKRVLQYYAEERAPRETLGDFCNRKGVEVVRARCE